MAYYMIQTSYTAESVKAMIENPQDRVEAIRPIVERLGGSVEGGWIAFGEYDAVAICQLPDNVSAAAFSLAASASGTVRAFKTTPLMTFEEAMEAMRKAGEVGYQPPGS